MTRKSFAVATIAAMLSFAGPAHAQDSGPYKVQKIQFVDGDGGFDYVTADPDGRNLYVARSGQPGTSASSTSTPWRRSAIFPAPARTAEQWTPRRDTDSRLRAR